MFHYPLSRVLSVEEDEVLPPTGLQPVPQDEVGGKHDGYCRQHEEQGQQNKRHDVALPPFSPARRNGTAWEAIDEENPGRDTRGMIVGGGWAPNRVCGVDYDPSSTLRIAHRLGLP